jgi:DNA adenine methylase
MRPPITYYGGKQSMVKDILPLIPEHNSYVEPFVGGGAVFWAKPPSKLETLNDRNRALIRFWRVLRDDPETWAKACDEPYSRALFGDYRDILRNHEAHTDLEVATAFAVCSGQCFNGQIGQWGFKKSKGLNMNLRGGGDVAKVVTWNINKAEYKKYASLYKKRLADVQIEDKDALKIIKSMDIPECVFYLDPPYIGTDCKAYEGEYTPADYEALLQALSTIQGKFMLSCFPTDLVRDYAAQNGWVIRSFEKQMCVNAKHQAKTGYKTKTELLVMNYVKQQNTLF